MSTTDEECEIEIEGNSYTRLTEVVRKQYFQFLQKQLEENFKSWKEKRVELTKEESKQVESLIYDCAKILEDSAIKDAIITQIYQRAMLKTISIVRQNTKECQLLELLEEKIFDLTEKSTKAKFDLTEKSTKAKNQSTNTIFIEYSTKETQTDDLEPAQLLSLDERINIFQRQLNKQTPFVENEKHDNVLKQTADKCQQKRRHSQSIEHNLKKKRSRGSMNVISNKNRLMTPTFLHSPTPPLSALPPLQKQTPIELTSSLKNSTEKFEMPLEADEIEEQLEKIFNESEEEEDLEQIFGISMKNLKCKEKSSPLVQSTNNFSKETENFSQTPIIEHERRTPIDTNKAIEMEQKSLIKSKQPNQTTTTTPQQPTNTQLYRQPVTDLRYSLWPCERFMQKKRLSLTLNRLVEEDIRWFDILKQQFSILFGDEPETDDFAQCSPSLELDEVLRSSCARRISPWVVTHLMKPLKDGLIGNRFLFKKLAKKLAHCIITENQYPDELLIKRSIENFFCLHPSVMTAEDINDIETMNLCNDE